MNISSKKYLIILILLASVLFSCNKAKIAELELQNSQLSEQTQQKDSLLNDFVSSFETFQQNLDLIKEREALVNMSNENPEMRKESKDQILQDIQTINELLAQNESIINDLTQKLEASEGKTNEFRKMVNQLKKQLATKDEEVASLKTNLADLDFSIETLNRRVETLADAATNLNQQNEQQSALLSEQEQALNTQTEKLNEQTTKLNTAYYIAGSTKELKDRKVLDSKTKLSGNLSESAFTSIDITKISSIPVDAKKAELLTSHPSDSYVFNQEDKKITSLEITNPAKFWKASKFLVLVTD